jgi:tetratricopeptide (TPR) repeat protein
MKSLERQMTEDLMGDAAPQEHDDELVRRLVEATLRRATPPPRALRWRRWALLVAALLVAGTVLAEWGRRGGGRAKETAPPHDEPTVAATPGTPSTLGEKPPATPSDSAGPPEVDVSDLPAVPKPSAARAPDLSAPQLYALANEARRKGNDRDAIRLYQRLEHEFPASLEAQASHVALGRLLLDREGDAAGALAELDRYLAEPGNRALREEALVGRAVALQRLGRRDAEAEAWRALLREYPESISAGRAKTRLGELEE